MRLNNKWIVAGLMAFGLLFTGCIFDEDGSTNPEITGFKLSTSGELQLATSYNLMGEVEAEKGISTITLELTPADGGDAISLTVEGGYAGKTSWDLEDANQSIVIPAGTATGTYNLKITVTDEDGMTSSREISVTVAGLTGTQVTSHTLDAGSNQNATLGSSIDLDNGMVYLSAAAASQVANLDLTYSYSGADNVDKFFTPSHATASNYDYAANWTGHASIEFYKDNSLDFDNLSTKEAIVAEWDASMAETTSITVSNGDIFIVKTSDGGTALVKVTDITAGETGSVTISVKI